MNHTEPKSDVQPTQTNEEIVDPAVPSSEHVIIIVRRHPFGLVVQYLAVIFGLALSFGLIFFLLPDLVNQATRDRTQMILSISAVAISALSALLLLVGTALYRQNRWIITDDNVTQVLRNGIFGTHISALSMANIENITSEKLGLFAHIFGFGTLEIETAGEQPNKFNFVYCPNPDKYAKILLDARERFINENPAAAKRANEHLNVPGAGGQI